MSTDEYLSSPILQSQRVWCEGNVILMRPTDPAPSGSQTLTNYLVPLLATHTWLCRALRCGQIFVLSPVSLVMMINGQSRPLIDHPIRENWQDGFNKTAQNVDEQLKTLSLAYFFCSYSDISKILFQTLKCLWLWDLSVCNEGLCSGNRDILWIFETPKLENKQLKKI